VSGPTNVLVLRAEDEFSRKLRSAGIEVTNLPLIRTEPLDDRSDLLRAIERIDEYDGLFVTSPAAAEIFINEMRDRGSVCPGKLYVMGGRANDVFTSAGYRTEFDDGVNTAEELIESREDKEFSGKKLLFVRGDRSMMTIPRLLKGNAFVDEVVVYRTVECVPSKDKVRRTIESLASGEIDWLCFFSPSAVEVFIKLFGTDTYVKTAVIGRTTKNRAIEEGFNVQVVSPRSNATDFAIAFISHLNGK
jgi:uroporphyrinogen-III synthase